MMQSFKTMKNFRDIAQYNSSVKPNHIFRGAAEDIMFVVNNISENATIIDLRMPNEIYECDYSYKLKSNLSIINIPIDLEKAKRFYNGTPMENAYKYFALNCNAEIAKILNVVTDTNDKIFIHCKQGMDRTGFIVSILQLICCTPIELIYQDYMQTGDVVLRKHLEISMQIIDLKGGVDNYLTENIISPKALLEIKNKISTI